MKFSRNTFSLGVWLAFLAACAFVIANTRFIADLSAFLPRNPDAEQRILVEQLREGVVARLLLVGIEGGTAAERQRISRDMGKNLRADKRFVTVQNGAAEALRRDQAFYFDHRYLLSAGTDPEKFTAEGLRQSIGESIEALSSTAGMMMKSLLPRDPTGETLGLIDNLQQQSGPRTENDVWVSPDGQRSIMLLQTAASGADTDGQAQAIRAIRSAFESSAGTSNARLLLTGPGVFSVNARATIKDEASRIATLSSLTIMALLLLVYRSPRLVGLGVLPVVTGTLAGIAAVSLGFGEVHGLTLGFGATLVGEAVDYAVYLFVQSDQSGSLASQRWQRDFWRTVLWGVATSVCGFAAMLVSGFPGLAQLGLYSMTGIVAAALVTRFVLPQMMPAQVRIRDVSRLGAALTGIADRLARFRWLLLALIVAAGALLAIRGPQVWDRDIGSLSPVPEKEKLLDGQLRADLGAPDTRYMLAMRTRDQESALQAAERLAVVLDALVDQGSIGGFESPARVLPSLATQQARKAALPDPTSLRRNLEQALVGMPIRAERLQGFLADVEATRQRPLLQRADLDGTSSALLVDSLLTQKGDSWSLLIPLRAPSEGPHAHVIDAEQVRSAIARAGIQNVAFIDLKAQSDALYADYLSEAIKLAAWGSLAVAAILAFALRSPRRLARVLLPIVAAVVVVMGGLVVAGQSLNMLHLIGLLLVVAVGSNYALFFDQAPGNAALAQQHRTVVSLVLANLTTVIAFGFLATSSVPVLAAIGRTVAPGALLALIFCAMSARRPSTAQAQ